MDESTDLLEEPRNEGRLERSRVFRLIALVRGNYPRFHRKDVDMFHPVCWPHEDAQDDNGVRKVTVILWEYEAKVGRARIGNCGPQVAVFLTDYAEGDLTIGVKNAPHPTRQSA